MSKVNVKAEVESVLGRELIGHEKAIVAHLANSGMGNPVDIARAMLERHMQHNSTRLDAINAERADLLAQLAKVDAASEAVEQPVESAPAAVEVANEYTAIAAAALKIGAPSNLDKLNGLLSLSHEVAQMLAKHESLAPVNVHSHGPIIADLVELTRRAHVLAAAYQLEVQGR